MGEPQKVVVVIPALNPPKKLIHMVETLVNKSTLFVIVVNDGSADKFSECFASISRLQRVQVVTNAANLGKGAALRVGINEALIQHPDLAGIVTADADGQHSVSDIISISSLGKSKYNHFVLGYRKFTSKVPLRSRLGNEISRILYRFMLALNLKDTQTGLRYLPREFSIHCLSLESNGYEFETEQLIQAASLKLPIFEHPIETIYLKSGQPSHFSPFFDSAKIYFLIFRYALSSIATSTVDLIVFAVLIRMGLEIIQANLLARSIALFVQYQLLGSFVFRASSGLIRFFLFVFYVMIMGSISGFLQISFPFSSMVGPIGTKIITEIGIYVFNFLFLRDVLFAKRN